MFGFRTSFVLGYLGISSFFPALILLSRARAQPPSGHHLADDDHGRRPVRCAHVMHAGRPVTWTLPFRCQILTPAARPCARPKPMSTLHAARSPTQGYPFRDRIVSPPCITCYAQPRKPPCTRVSSRKRFTFPQLARDAPPYSVKFPDFPRFQHGKSFSRSREFVYIQHHVMKIVMPFRRARS